MASIRPGNRLTSRNKKYNEMIEIKRKQQLEKSLIKDPVLQPKRQNRVENVSEYDRAFTAFRNKAISKVDKDIQKILLKKAYDSQLSTKEQEKLNLFKYKQTAAFRSELASQYNKRNTTVENLLNEAIWREKLYDNMTDKTPLHSGEPLGLKQLFTPRYDIFTDDDIGLTRMFNKRYFKKITRDVPLFTECRFYNRHDRMTVNTFLSEHPHPKNIQNYLNYCIRKNGNVKVNAILKCTFDLDINGVTRIAPLRLHPTNFSTNLDREMSNRYLNDLIHEYETMIDKFERRSNEDSQGNNKTGAVLRKIHYIELRAVAYVRTRAGKYIEFDKKLKCIINPKNENDDFCFKWCMLIHKHWNDVTNDHRERITKYKRWQDELNFTGIEFPVHLDKITKFEKQNPEFAVNVFNYNEVDDSRSPIRIARKYWSEDELSKRSIVNLILIGQQQDRVLNTHYVYITDLNKFLGGNLCIKPINNKQQHETSETTHHKRYFCEMCCQGYISEVALKSHKEVCQKHEPTRTILPEPGSTLKFANINKTFKHDMVVYSDLEAILHKVDRGFGNVGKIKQEHRVCAWGMYDTLSKKYRQYKNENNTPESSENCLKEFERELKELVRTWMKYHTKPTPIIITPKQEEDFSKLKETDLCYMCNKAFGINKYKRVDKVRDHCHVSGLYRGPAHYNCNLQNSIPTYIPILFHNGSGYDIHHLIKHLARMKDDILNPHSDSKVETTMIPISSEKFISFSVKFLIDYGDKDSKSPKYIELRFLDSFRFMASGLDSLVKTCGGKLPITNKFFTGEDYKLVTRKGVFPYEWFDSFDKLSYTELPPIKDFSSLLSGDISDDSYKSAHKVWQHFKMKTFKENMELYLQTDVLLLADVFEGFRDLCLQYYKLDPVHYYTSANVSWDALLKMSNVELDLLSDPDMYMFFEDAIRGGVSQVGSTRYAKKTEGKNHLMYIDANNLYGHAMVNKLPIRDFKWFEPNQCTVENILNIVRNYNLFEGSLGAVVEVRLTVPEHLHDYFNDFPLAPENRKIKITELNKWQQDKYKNHSESVSSKLVCTLNVKDKYKVSLECLQFYLQQGLILEEVYRGVWFTQNNWMSEYIMLNTKLRAEAKAQKNDFKVEFFKLMNNAVFGKTMENVRRYQNMHLMHVDDRAKILLKTNKDFYNSYNIIDNDLVIISMCKSKVSLCKPIYVGSKVLDLSKLHMYNFYYNCLKRKLQERVSLIYMDTDSFFLEIKTPDITQEFNRQEIDEWFDTANYPKDHPWYSEKNNSVLGKFKDEAKGYNILEVCALASKMYGYSREAYPGESGITESLKCKGVVRKAVKEYNLQRMKDVLVTGEDSEASKQYRITSRAHNLFTVEEYKKNCRLMDDKRFILDDVIDEHKFAKTRALGHWRNIKPYK